MDQRKKTRTFWLVVFLCLFILTLIGVSVPSLRNQAVVWYLRGKYQLIEMDVYGTSNGLEKAFVRDAVLYELVQRGALQEVTYTFQPALSQLELDQILRAPLPSETISAEASETTDLSIVVRNRNEAKKWQNFLKAQDQIRLQQIDPNKNSFSPAN